MTKNDIDYMDVVMILIGIWIFVECLGCQAQPPQPQAMTVQDADVLPSMKTAYGTGHPKPVQVELPIGIHHPTLIVVDDNGAFHGSTGTVTVLPGDGVNNLEDFALIHKYLQRNPKLLVPYIKLWGYGWPAIESEIE